MKIVSKLGIDLLAIVVVATFPIKITVRADDAKFHNAPEEIINLKNPFAGQAAAAEAGGKIFAANCAICHGQYGQGTGEIPALVRGPAQAATDGEVFCFITTGSLNSGMPSWQRLPEKEPWELVTFLKSLPTTRRAPPKRHVVAPAAPGESITLQAPPKPFTDFRFEEPSASRKITVGDLPEAHATKSAENGAPIVERPKDVMPKAPAGFQVELYATGLDNPRAIRTAPNGEIFVAESAAGKIEVFRGITREHRPEQMQEFATGLNQPYGIACYPPGPNPEWVYIGDTDEVLRFPYRNGDLTARSASQHIAKVPPGGGHWTRDIQFSPDGKKMYVAVGSRSNNDDSDNNPEEKNRANILEFNPDATEMRIYGYGIRNAGGGLAIQPGTGVL